MGIFDHPAGRAASCPVQTANALRRLSFSALSDGSAQDDSGRGASPLFSYAPGGPLEKLEPGINGIGKLPGRSCTDAERDAINIYCQQEHGGQCIVGPCMFIPDKDDSGDGKLYFSCGRCPEAPTEKEPEWRSF